MANLVRVGDTVIDLDNVMFVDLDVTYDDEPDQTPRVAVSYLSRGSDRLDNGDNVAVPYVDVFENQEADGLRRYFEAVAPDIAAG